MKMASSSLNNNSSFSESVALMDSDQIIEELDVSAPSKTYEFRSSILIVGDENEVQDNRVQYTEVFEPSNQINIDIRVQEI
jgi:hypothetical protein